MTLQSTLTVLLLVCVMESKAWFCLMLLLCCVTAAFTCQETQLNAKYNIFHKGILCSTQKEDISTVGQKIHLFKRPNVIGIYAMSRTIGHVCYWKEVESGLVDVMTLTGGIIHMAGKVN